MARILVPYTDSWYSELNTVAFYGETEFEQQLKQHVSSIFTNYYVFSYKQGITDSSGTEKRPDMALLSKDYNEWWILENELSHHGYSHVKSQVEVFTYGEYNSIIVTEYIFKQIKKEHGVERDFDKIKNLVSQKNPGVMVIVDENQDEWEKGLSDLGVNLCIFQVFKDFKGNQVYQLDGQYPIAKSAQSHCRYNKLLPNLLEVISPSIVSHLVGQEIEIDFNSKLTRWKVIEDKGNNYLQFAGIINPIPANYEYALSVDFDKKYYIKKV